MSTKPEDVLEANKREYATKAAAKFFYDELKKFNEKNKIIGRDCNWESPRPLTDAEKTEKALLEFGSADPFPGLLKEGVYKTDLRMANTFKKRAVGESGYKEKVDNFVDIYVTVDKDGKYSSSFLPDNPEQYKILYTEILRGAKARGGQTRFVLDMGKGGDPKDINLKNVMAILQAAKEPPPPPAAIRLGDNILQKLSMTPKDAKEEKLIDDIKAMEKELKETLKTYNSKLSPFLKEGENKGVFEFHKKDLGNKTNSLADENQKLKDMSADASDEDIKKQMQVVQDKVKALDTAMKNAGLASASSDDALRKDYLNVLKDSDAVIKTAATIVDKAKLNLVSPPDGGDKLETAFKNVEATSKKEIENIEAVIVPEKRAEATIKQLEEKMTELEAVVAANKGLGTEAAMKKIEEAFNAVQELTDKVKEDVYRKDNSPELLSSGGTYDKAFQPKGLPADPDGVFEKMEKVVTAIGTIPPPPPPGDPVLASAINKVTAASTKLSDDVNGMSTEIENALQTKRKGPALP